MSEKKESKRVKEAVWIDKFLCPCGCKKYVSVAFNRQSLEYRLRHINRIEDALKKGKATLVEEVTVKVTEQEVKTN